MRDDDASERRSVARLAQLLARVYPAGESTRSFGLRVRASYAHVSNILGGKLDKGGPSLDLADRWLDDRGYRLVLDIEPKDNDLATELREDIRAFAELPPEHRHILAEFARLMRLFPELPDDLEHELGRWHRRLHRNTP